MVVKGSPILVSKRAASNALLVTDVLLQMMSDGRLYLRFV